MLTDLTTSNMIQVVHNRRIADPLSMRRVLNVAFAVILSNFVLLNATRADAHTLKNTRRSSRVLVQDSVPSNRLGEQLWSTGHESGSQADWFVNGGGGEFNSNTGNSFVSTELARTGNYALKMSINTTKGGGHATRNYRWKEISEHNDLIFTQYFYFPNRIDFDRNNNWFNLIQTKGVKFAPGGAGTGPDQINLPHYVLGLEVRGGAGSGGANYLSLADLQKFWGSNPDVTWKAPAGIDLPVGKWVKIQLRIIQDRGDKGRVLVWQDDTLIIDTGFRNTLKPEVDVNMFSINAYADKTFPHVTNIFLDDLSINLPGMPEVEKEPEPLTAPQAAIVSPRNETVITEGDGLTIETQVATDPRAGISQVAFFSNDTWMGATETAPYDFSIPSLPAGSYRLRAKIWDTKGNVSNSEEVNLLVLAKSPVQSDIPESVPEEQEEISVHYGFGSNDAVTFEGVVFARDPGPTLFSGTSYTFSNPEASDLPLYQQERNSPDLRLKIPVKNGRYTVITHHNELWFGKRGPAAGPGKRVFSIEMEGNNVKEALDLYRESNNAPLKLTFRDIEVVDGVLDIRMLARFNRATLSGISIISHQQDAPNTAPVKNTFQLSLNTGSSKSTVFGTEEFLGEIGSVDFFNSPTTYQATTASSEELFQSERHGLNLTYKIPVPNGTYVVKTYHNELWFGKEGPTAGAGRRVFSISLEGKQVKRNLDLFLVSNNQPLELVFEEVVVQDGLLELALEASANRATISGISIFGSNSSSGTHLRVAQNQEQPVHELTEAASVGRISLYPNPAQDRIFLEGSTTDFQQFLIHDTLGNLLFRYDAATLQKEGQGYLLSLPGIKEGVYLISIVKMDNSVERLRFLVVS